MLRGADAAVYGEGKKGEVMLRSEPRFPVLDLWVPLRRRWAVC